jgi:hypothetical protein
MVVIGYQGIGKSSTAKHLDNCIDLESSNFWITDESGDRHRCSDWEAAYANLALDLSSQGNIVFVSSHQKVRVELYKRNIKLNQDIIMIYPSEILKDDWLVRLKDRYEKDPSKKNEAAYLNAVDRFSDNIREMIDDADLYGFRKVAIENIPYNLKNVIDLVEDELFTDYVMEEINSLPKLDFEPDDKLLLEVE